MHRMSLGGLVATALSGALLAGCASGGYPNAAGVSAVDLPVERRGLVSGVGIEGHDIVSMTDRMMRDILGSSFMAAATTPPRVIVDGQYFVNEGSQPLNKNAITDRLRVELNRASQGRMVFVGRQYSTMVAEERALKREGVTDVGTTGLTHAQAGGDFRLGGRISSLDSRSAKTGLVQRYNQIVFEMVDLESGVIVWSGIYELQRAGADDVVYR